MGGRILRAGWKLLVSLRYLALLISLLGLWQCPGVPPTLHHLFSAQVRTFIPFLNICSPNGRPFDLLGKGERV